MRSLGLKERETKSLITLNKGRQKRTNAQGGRKRTLRIDNLTAKSKNDTKYLFGSKPKCVFTNSMHVVRSLRFRSSRKVNHLSEYVGVTKN